LSLRRSPRDCCSRICTFKETAVAAEVRLHISPKMIKKTNPVCPLRICKNLLQLVLPTPSRKGSSRMRCCGTLRTASSLRVGAMSPDGYVCRCFTAGISSFWHGRQCTLNEGTARLSRRWCWAPRSYARTMAGNVPRAANLRRKNQGSNEGKKVGGLNNSTGWLAGDSPTASLAPNHLATRSARRVSI
jgi:hypothetical protein